MTLGLTAGYLLLSVLPHDLVNQFVLEVQKGLTPPVFGFFAGLMALLGLTLVTAISVQDLRSGPAARVKALYWGVTLTLMVLSFGTIIAVNSEVIHFLQYALLSLLLFSLTRRFSTSMLLALLFSILDEAFQYFVLHRHWGIYFDFNDLVLNGIGAGLGLVILATLLRFPRRLNEESASLLVWNRANLLLGVAVAAFALAVWLGWVDIAPSSKGASSAYVILDRSAGNRAFWTQPDSWGHTFHVLTAWEGVLVTAGLVLFYSTLDRLLEPVPPPSSGSG